MRRMVLCLALGMLWLLAAGSWSMAADIPAMELKFASGWPPPPQSLTSVAHQMWVDEVTKRTGGKVTFRTFWGASMAKAGETLSIVQRGMADVGSFNGSWNQGKLPLAQFEYIFPLGVSDPVILTKTKMKIFEEFPEFAKDFANNGSVHLMNTSGTVYGLFGNVEARTLKDFANIKIAMIGRYFGQWFQPLKTVPVVAPVFERYNFLQNKAVDLSLDPIDMVAAYKYYEQCKYYIICHLFLANYGDLIVNKKQFDSFPPELRQIMTEVGKEIDLMACEKMVPEWEQSAHDTFVKAGLTTIQFDESQYAQWAAMLPDIPSTWAKEVTEAGYPGWEIVKRFQEISAEYGWKWTRTWGVEK